ncbi:Acetylglutamate kinase [Legionella busanensis]|uniref:Acetylglutamate kinase n=1 Tax=Legionella busanensis TaxID=190655 RepID=A0A378JMB5_9GAMM|nr:acetylglutamate kinase [Legionella busanensis]STX51443.1 Acetylglutamate kinase [Legionella busanensis]
MNSLNHAYIYTATSKLILIKIGGSILHDPNSVSALIRDIKAILTSGYQIVLVHGGSKAINEALQMYGIESKFIEGLRVTSSAAIKVIEMVLCGQVNQMLVRMLNQMGIKAAGLSGAQNHMLQCNYLDKKYGFVGEVKQVNSQDISHLLANQITPVIATIGVDDIGHAVNINGDMAAYHLASALAVDKLIYLTDQDGIYNNDGQLLRILSENNLHELVKNAIVSNGMLVKVKAILKALQCNLDQVMIANGMQPYSLINAILKQHNPGTLCLKNQN